MCNNPCRKGVIKLFKNNFNQMKPKSALDQINEDRELALQHALEKIKQMSPEEISNAIRKETEMVADIGLSLIRLTCRLNFDQIKDMYLKYSNGELEIRGQSWRQFIESTELQEWLHLQASLIRIYYTYYGLNARFRSYIDCPLDCEQFPTANYRLKVETSALETLDEGQHGTVIATLCSYFIFKLLFPKKNCVIFMDEKPHVINDNLEFRLFDR